MAGSAATGSARMAPLCSGMTLCGAEKHSKAYTHFPSGLTAGRLWRDLGYQISLSLLCWL